MTETLLVLGETWPKGFVRRHRFNYVTPSGEWEPELDDYLGDLTNEVPDIFVTGGPKNYAYTLRNAWSETFSMWS